MKTKPKAVKLDSAEFAILLELDAVQPGSKEKGRNFQFNTWALQADVRPLTRLKKRGLVDSEGRGLGKQWWITPAGIDAYETRAAQMLLAKYNAQNS